MYRVLVIEDDIELNKMIAKILRKSNYNVLQAYTVKESKIKLTEHEYSLVILDINLSDGTGYDICHYIKERELPTAIIIVSANDLEEDILKGYQGGAVDYITKPFSISILQLKIKAILSLKNTRSNRVISDDVYQEGDLYINFSTMELFIKEQKIQLTPLEFRVMKCFVDNKGILLTRNKLLEHLWDISENFVEDHTLTATISHIRKKLKSEDREYIKTVYGMGYIFHGGIMNEKS